MEKKTKVLQIYSIIVCIIAIITFLISVSLLVGALIDKNSRLDRDVNYSSFEKFKMNTLKGTTDNAAYIPDDESLRVMYDAALKNRQEDMVYRANKDIVINSVVISIAILLFVCHWLLFKNPEKKSVSG